MAGRPGNTPRSPRAYLPSNPGGWLSAAGSLSISLLSRYFAAHVTHHLPARAAPLRRRAAGRATGRRVVAARALCPLSPGAWWPLVGGQRPGRQRGPLIGWRQAGRGGGGGPAHRILIITYNIRKSVLMRTESCCLREAEAEREREREREKFASIFDQEIGR